MACLVVITMMVGLVWSVVETLEGGTEDEA